MNTKELIEIARECCSYPVKVSDYHWCGEGEFIFTEAGLNAFAQRIEQPHLQHIAELELALQKQAKAALQGMDSAKSNAAEMLKSANEIQSRLNPELIESERQANAVLTEENEKLIEVVRQRSHKIAELEKDCEILQTNYDAALMQVKQLREALQLIKIKDENKMYKSCPDCDYPGTCESDMVCKSMPRSSIGNIANRALEQTK